MCILAFVNFVKKKKTLTNIFFCNSADKINTGSLIYGWAILASNGEQNSLHPTKSNFFTHYWR